uniref:Uncharacterized protein n=1 Tax=Caenorhabditis japonica TaxID=281687 RepID=A0A8R1EQ24_CAEJA
MDTVLTLLDQANSVEHVEKEQQEEEVEKEQVEPEELEEPLEPEEPEESLDEERTVLSDLIPSVFLQEQLANV